MTKNIENRNMKLMEDIISYLQKQGMFDAVYLYVNGHRYSNEKKSDTDIEKATKYGAYYDNGEYDVTEYIKYNNPEILTMAFEGSLYQEYNGTYGSYKAENEIRKICDKYGLYPEQGYAWSLAVYE